MVDINASTVRRRKIAGKMSVREGETIVRYAHLLDLTLALMEGNKSHALQWLTTPARALGGETPIDYAFISLGCEICHSNLSTTLYSAAAGHCQ